VAQASCGNQTGLVELFPRCTLAFETPLISSYLSHLFSGLEGECTGFFRVEYRKVIAEVQSTEVAVQGNGFSWSARLAHLIFRIVATMPGNDAEDRNGTFDHAANLNAMWAIVTPPREFPMTHLIPDSWFRQCFRLNRGEREEAKQPHPKAAGGEKTTTNSDRPRNDCWAASLLRWRQKRQDSWTWDCDDWQATSGRRAAAPFPE